MYIHIYHIHPFYIQDKSLILKPHITVGLHICTGATNHNRPEKIVWRFLGNKNAHSCLTVLHCHYLMDENFIKEKEPDSRV